MFDLKFDVNKFLAMPLNDGCQFLQPCGRYGCIKGDFALCSNVVEGLENISGNQRKYNAIRNMLGPKTFGLSTVDPLLYDILDRAENLLLFQNRPQFAKLFLVRALRKFGYIPKAEPTFNEVRATVQPFVDSLVTAGAIEQ